MQNIVYQTLAKSIDIPRNKENITEVLLYQFISHIRDKKLEAKDERRKERYRRYEEYRKKMKEAGTCDPLIEDEVDRVSFEVYNCFSGDYDLEVETICKRGKLYLESTNLFALLNCICPYNTPN